ncbi:MAG: cytochrome c peroxidase [Pseudomonadota bacterium]
MRQKFRQFTSAIRSRLQGVEHGITAGFYVILAGALAAIMLGVVGARTDEPDEPEEPAPIASLKSVAVPGMSDEEALDLIRDKDAAIALGKALFWDTRVGSDNRTACASCHFHAGADNRIRNQLNPGLLAGDKTFQLGGPNYTLTADDFPLTRHADLDDAASMTQDRNDVVSSQGVFTRDFGAVSPAGTADSCMLVSDAVEHGGSGFNLHGINTRRVEPRNAPSVINTVFNFRNFWDGRANNVYNGAEPFGLRNPDVMVWKVEDGVLRQVRYALQFAPLASLASGPPLSENEMSCRGRVFVNLGKKLIGMEPLAGQTVSRSDSVLGRLPLGDLTYGKLIERAFQGEYWDSPVRIKFASAGALAARNMDLPRSTSGNGSRAIPARDEATVMEANFALFFGVALQLYQATLISDDAPFDRYAEGDRSALTARQLRGLALFRGKAGCVHCHSGAEFTSASFANVMDEGRLDQRAGANDTVFRYDNGFFNTGVRPTADDPGVGGFDPFGLPLSEVRMSQIGRTDLLGTGFDEAPVDPAALTALDGAFKTPGLRNVELTGPYFHNGGKATLMQVLDFYNRGGDFTAQNQPVPDPAIHPLGLVQREKDELVDFLLSLTDERVRFRKAPFDHPSLCVPHGHVGNAGALQADTSGSQAIDVMLCLPEVGAGGAQAPLLPFLGKRPFER